MRVIFALQTVFPAAPFSVCVVGERREGAVVKLRLGEEEGGCVAFFLLIPLSLQTLFFILTDARRSTMGEEESRLRRHSPSSCNSQSHSPSF